MIGFFLHGSLAGVFQGVITQMGDFAGGKANVAKNRQGMAEPAERGIRGVCGHRL